MQSPTKVSVPQTHVIHFIGDHPCNSDGTIITGIQHASQEHNFGNGIVIKHSFSNKPANGYANYYEKMVRYADIISAPAKSLDDRVTEKTFRVMDDQEDDSVFQYSDTNSSRANINQLNSKFKGQKIGIIGLGGTGSYVLDAISKSPVTEIHLFDGAIFSQHNAFRSPGAASKDDLDRILKKVEYYAEKYSNIHKHVIPHALYITEDTLRLLQEMTYVFICVDKNSVRKLIIEGLIKLGISFIDVGLGVNIVDDKLLGTIRVTNGSPEKNDHISLRAALEEDEGENEYNTNIQIVELNSMNAAFAVIKWKKMSGFYHDSYEEHHSSYSISNSKLINEDTQS
jgi:hypothetical protein